MNLKEQCNEMKKGCGYDFEDGTYCCKEDELCECCKSEHKGFLKGSLQAFESELEFLEFPAYCTSGADCCKKLCEKRIEELKKNNLLQRGVK